MERAIRRGRREARGAGQRPHARAAGHGGGVGPRRAGRSALGLACAPAGPRRPAHARGRARADAAHDPRVARLQYGRHAPPDPGARGPAPGHHGRDRARGARPRGVSGNRVAPEVGAQARRLGPRFRPGIEPPRPTSGRAGAPPHRGRARDRPGPARPVPPRSPAGAGSRRGRAASSSRVPCHRRASRRPGGFAPRRTRGVSVRRGRDGGRALRWRAGGDAGGGGGPVPLHPLRHPPRRCRCFRRRLSRGHGGVLAQPGRAEADRAQRAPRRAPRAHGRGGPAVRRTLRGPAGMGDAAWADVPPLRRAGPVGVAAHAAGRRRRGLDVSRAHADVRGSLFEWALRLRLLVPRTGLGDARSGLRQPRERADSI